MISKDMLPAHQRNLQDPAALRAYLEIPVAERARHMRTLPDLPYPGG